MDRYLVYDGGCSVCNNLATAIQEAAGAKLTAISIREDSTRALLDRVYPQGWSHAPYLISAENDRVRAWSGAHAAARLGLLLGPRKACRIWSLAWRHGVSPLMSTSPTSPPSASRRHLLKLGAVSLAIGTATRWLSPSTAAGCDVCYGCCGPLDCYMTATVCYLRDSCYPYGTKYYVYDCYSSCGVYCNQQQSFCCCTQGC